ncbi:MAG TPA: DUF1707 domain-containing protein, partial [Longimicrobiales bacterium]|nr:DUF1707 domain-containing protein [Longimicrobiales bacterium]
MNDPEPPAGREAGPPPARAIQPEVRQKAVDLLCEAFAEDHIPVEEFERRVDAVHAASSEAELRELLADLPKPAPPVRRKSSAPERESPATDALSVPSRRPTVSPEQVRDQSVVAGLLGGASRTGPWTPARTNWVVGVFGGAELDFREARMPPGVTEVRVFTMFGGAEIVVPPDVRVECSGIGILGGFDEKHTVESTTDPDAPVLRISGFALLGGVSVNVRYRGESERDAKQRRRQERKARRRLRRG